MTSGSPGRVLLVEDEPALARAVAVGLRSRGWHVTAVPTGGAAVDHVVTTPVDVVVLDLGLPDLDGTAVITAVRSFTSVPVIVLSARRDTEDKVGALDLGADDYVTKPFEMTELFARVRAALRRGSTTTTTAEAAVTTGDLVVDLARQRVTRGGEEVKLSPTEWHMLEILVRHRDRLVSRKELLDEIWGTGFSPDTHYLRVYSAQLRRKLEDDPSRPVHIVTVPGRGYRFS